MRRMTGTSTRDEAMAKARFEIEVRHFRREAIAGDPDAKSYRTVEIEPTTETVEVEVDMEALAKTLGPRAANSRGKIALEAGGLVKVRLIRK
jgi:hypothetical protein